MKKYFRPFLLVFFLIFFLSLLIASAFKDRHVVSGKSRDEFYIIEQSTTHKIERDEAGKLSDTLPITQDKATDSDSGPEPCPT